MAGAIVINQESPWTQLLGGIGEGLAQGTRIGMEMKQKELDLEKEILAGTASGKYDPRIWASKAGRDFLKTAKLEKRPGIQNLIRSGEALLPQDLPSSVPGKTAATPSGDVVNIPTPDQYLLKRGVSDPANAMDTKAVQDLIEAEELGKKMKQAQEESDIIFQRQAAMDGLRWARMQNIGNPAVLIETVRQSLIDANANLDDWNITANSKGQISVTYNRAGSGGKVTANKAIEMAEGYDNGITQAAERRTSHIYRLGAILGGDVSMATADVDPNDQVAMALKAAAEAISSSKGSQKKIMERASRVNSLLKTINDEITARNSALEAAGKRAGKDAKLIEANKLKPIVFEDISGGVSMQDWLKQRALEDKDPKDLISEMRSEPLGGGVPPGRPSETRAGTDADRLMRVYKGLKDIVVAATASNPDLTSDMIKSNILGMKREIMSEYGLNERLWSMLMTMSNKVMG